MQALDGYKVCHAIPRIKMEVHSPPSVPRSLSPVSIEHDDDDDGRYANYSPLLSTCPPTSFSSPSRHRLKRDYDYDYDYVNVDITPLKMDPFAYEAHADPWNTFLYNTDVTEQQQQQQQQQQQRQQQLLFNEQDDMNPPQPYTIFPTSYGVSQGNPNQLGMIPGQQQQQQQWDMTSHTHTRGHHGHGHGHQQPQPHAHHLQYPTHPQAYYPVTPLSPGQPIPHMATPGSSLVPTSAHYQQHQQQGWSTSIPPQYTTTSHGHGHTHARIQHQHTPSPPEPLAFAPVVPSSSPNCSSSYNRGGGNDSSDNDLAPSSTSQPTLSTRYSTAMAWLTRTSPSLTPTQISIARAILRSSWWENESAEPELRADDELVVKGLIAVPGGGSRFRVFLDEERGWRCTFDHDGVPCGHGKGRMERALGTIRGFFVYKPVVCAGGCGTRCEQRFVSVEQCQKHVQKKRSGRVACSECGSSILPANMSRHRRACHAAAA